MALLMRRFCLAAALFLAYAGFSMPARGDSDLQLHEQEIKVGLIYNFLKYIEWPGAAADVPSIAVCVFGDDPFNGYLQPMAGRSVNRREIVLHNIRDLQAAAGCDLVFVNAAERERWPQLLKSLDGKSVLTVSDFGGFAGSGGMIEFGLKDNHIEVLLNIDAATAARLHVEDRLLKLVTIVHAEGR